MKIGERIKNYRTNVSSKLLEIYKKKYFWHTAVCCFALLAGIGIWTFSHLWRSTEPSSGDIAPPPVAMGTGDNSSPTTATTTSDNAQPSTVTTTSDNTSPPTTTTTTDNAPPPTTTSTVDDTPPPTATGISDIVPPSNAVSIKALAADGDYCIPADSAFLLSFSEPVEKESIVKWLKTSPQIDYALEKTTNDLEYKLTPQVQFAPNTVYTFGYDPIQTEQNLPVRAANSFAFQTQKEFGIVRTLPRNQSTGVPVNTAIELTFTDDINIDDLTDKVTFIPELGGAWRKTNVSTYSFAPDKTLQNGTVYEVCVNGSLTDAIGAQKLGEDYAFKFSTDGGDQKNNVSFHVNNKNNAFMSTETPAFEIYYYSQTGRGDEIIVKIFQFENIDHYAKAVNDELNYNYWSGQARPTIDTSSLNKAYENPSEIYGDDNNFVVVVPQILQTGFYVAEFSLDGHIATSLFQVTDLSAFSMSDKDDRLFWVNDLSTSLPVSDAEVSKIGGERIGTTDAQGILKAKDTDNSIYIVQKGNIQLLVTVGQNNDASLFNSLDYWKYIYIDKELYSPNDTINFFGIISPKLPGTKAIDNVTAVIKKSYWDSDDSSEIKIDVNVENGVFNGQIQLPELAPDHYYLSIYYGDNILNNQYFKVEIYKKPAYDIKLSSDKPIYWVGEEATVTATAEYFDGTPVSGLDMVLDGIQCITDSDGNASVKVSDKSAKNYLFSSRYVSADAVLPEIGDVYKYLSVPYVNSNIEINTTAKRNGEACKLGVQAFFVDIDGIDDIWNNKGNYLKDFDGSASLNVSFTKIVWDKVPTGEKKYDPYTKTYADSYTYERREQFESMQSITVTGKDMQYFEIPISSGESYDIEIEGTDSSGRMFVRSEYLLSIKNSRDNERKIFRIKSNDDKDKYAIGEMVSLSLYENNAEIIELIEQGTILFVRANDRFIDYTVTQDNNLSFVFDNKYLPNINVFCVYFDGREYIDANEYWNYDYFSIRLDGESRTLFVDVTPDKQSYMPGDTAKLTLKLTDANNRPVKGYININMVDEALLSMHEQYVDINASIFNNYYHFWPRTASSHTVIGNEDAGGGGAEGGGERSEFRDTAVFKTLETDNNGTATLEAKLPDNITSWRIFWQAFNPGDVMAGSGRSNIIVTMPFFIDIRLGDTFIAGDKPNLGIRNAGTALADGDVRYAVEIPSLDFSKKSIGKTSAWHEIEMPLLSGVHDITVSADYKGHSDKIVSNFSVVDSVMTHMKTDIFTLSENAKIDIPVKGAVSLLFTDRQKAQVTRALQKFMHTGAIRVEQLIAKKTAEDILTDTMLYGYSSGTDYAAKIAEHQNSDGGISPFTYSEADLETTVWACAVSSESFNTAAAANYLYSQMNRAKDEGEIDNATLALAGLSTLKEPVLQYIFYYSQQVAAPEDKLNLALACMFFGDSGNAKNMVRELISDNCKSAGNTMYWNAKTREEIIKHTANLAAAAVLLDMPEGDMLFQYVLENKGEEDLYLLQQALILKHKALSVNPDCATFSYTLGGKEKEVKLWISQPLMLTAEQLREIKFSGINQEIEVSAIYSVAGFPQGDASASLSVSQKYPDYIDSATQGTVTGEISYGINAEAPDGYYSIVHILPAGLDFSGLDRSMADKGVWVSEVKGKQVTFTVYKNKEGRTGNIIFNARTTMTGSFKSEGAYIINEIKSEVFNKAEGGIVNIK